MSGVDVQDFNPVVIGKRTKDGSGFASGSNGQANDKKQAGVVGIGGKLESGAARKLDDNEAKAPDTVGRKVAKAIQTAREGKEWDQKALASNLNITKAVVVQLEQGTHKKDNQLLQRLEKKLGVWLTGGPDKIGTLKAEKEKKKVAPVKKTSKTVKEKVDKDDQKKESGDGVSADEAAAADDSDTDKKAAKAKKASR